MRDLATRITSSIYPWDIAKASDDGEPYHLQTGDRLICINTYSNLYDMAWRISPARSIGTSAPPPKRRL